MSKDQFIIGFSNLDEKNPFTVQVRQHLESEVAKHPNLTLVVRDNDMNTPNALKNAQEFLSIPVDLAILFHIDERAGVDLVIPFQRRRIPVIAIDIPLSTAIFFGINAKTAGLTAGEALGKWVQNHWDGALEKVLVMTEYRVLEIFKLRFDYALQALSSQVHYDVNDVLYMDNGNDRAVTVARVTEVMEHWTEFHKIAVICMNDKVAGGVLEAVRALGREQDVAVLSYDGTPYAIEEFQKPNSRLIVSPSFRAEVYGQRLVELSLRILNGEKVPNFNYVEPICLTRDNFEQWI